MGQSAHQILKCCCFVQRHVVVMLRCCRNLTLVYVNYPMTKLVLLYIISPKVVESIDSKRGLTVSFSGNRKELSVDRMCDVAEGGSFNKAEKFTSPSDALRLSTIWVSALRQDCRSGAEGHALLLPAPDCRLRSLLRTS
uniref:Uncharacterized protein n=1 Tax=Rousettus aegyptiacus TaxID=9407 RepID=A0A7J8IM80_ROUAE|nr:hypothetical protein HJG63_010557 [Rousettus aegyptiacus]